MRAVILSVGSELLRGDIVDTNAAFLARELTQLGFAVQGVEAVGDDLTALREGISRALSRADVVICSGGLGPTADDLTREAIAAALDEELEVDPTLLEVIQRRFAAMHRPMAPSNARQAAVIASAEPIPNPHGTAPGWFVSHDDRRIAALPGPPAELEPMWRDQVRPRLEEMLDRTSAMGSLMTFGVGESALERDIADVIDWRSDVTIATYAKPDGVQVHVTALAATHAKSRRLLREALDRLRERLGVHVVGAGEETLPSVIGTLLEQRRMTLAVMESCTGGELASLITDIAGSSNYFAGGIVAYTREVKASFGVDVATMDRHGLISAETALSMADAARCRLSADVGIGTTGVAGDEPVEGKAPGTCFLAVNVLGDETVREVHRPGRRDISKRYFALCALDLLRRRLAPADRVAV